MGEFLKWLAMALLSLPSKESTESEAVYQWRRNVALSIIVLGGVMVIFIVAAFGYFTGAGFGGFAMASDVQALLHNQAANSVRQIENDIRDDRKLQCEAIMEDNMEAKDYAFRRLQTDTDSYFVAMKFPARVPDCLELIPAAPSKIETPPTPMPSPAARAAAAVK